MNKKWFYTILGAVSLIVFALLAYQVGTLIAILSFLQIVTLVFILKTSYQWAHMYAHPPIDFVQGLSTDNPAELNKLNESYLDVKKAIFELDMDLELGKISSIEHKDQMEIYKKRAYLILHLMDTAQSPKAHYHQQIERDLNAFTLTLGHNPQTIQEPS